MVFRFYREISNLTYLKKEKKKIKKFFLNFPILPIKRVKILNLCVNLIQFEIKVYFLKQQFFRGIHDVTSILQYRKVFSCIKTNLDIIYSQTTKYYFEFFFFFKNIIYFVKHLLTYVEGLMIFYFSFQKKIPKNSSHFNEESSIQKKILSGTIDDSQKKFFIGKKDESLKEIKKSLLNRDIKAIDDILEKNIGKLNKSFDWRITKQVYQIQQIYDESDINREFLYKIKKKLKNKKRKINRLNVINTLLALIFMSLVLLRLKN